MERLIFVGRLGVSPRSHMYYHSLVAACRSHDPDRGRKDSSNQMSDCNLAGTKNLGLISDLDSPFCYKANGRHHARQVVVELSIQDSSFEPLLRSILST